MYAEKITAPGSGQLLGVQVGSKNPSALISIEQKRMYLFEMLKTISRQAAFFQDEGLFCSIVVADDGMAALLTFDHLCRSMLKTLPFVTLQLPQGLHTKIEDLSRGVNSVWLADVGNGHPFVQSCDVVVLDEEFARVQIDKETFNILINNIRRYSDRIIVRTGDMNKRVILQNAGVWGCAGLYAPTPLTQVNTLL
ncbi:hypothetical protein ACP26C_09140 [Franconibacter helveticus 513]|uniref:hypothetical protein n=1 Tax=Franconibacter helveticus TaxID=357240 RepID=UPI000465DC29|nr:hypothetical protein [Franconibacter helveticus]MDU6926857.1 hypothetical protein [Franconibacter helveticus]